MHLMIVAPIQKYPTEANVLFNLAAVRDDQGRQEEQVNVICY